MITERQKYLLTFLRGAHKAKDSTGSVRVKSDLLEETARELEDALFGQPSTAAASNRTEKFRYYLNWAHIHAERAYGMLFDEEGPKRPYFMRAAIDKAQNILITWYVRELKRKEDKE